MIDKELKVVLEHLKTQRQRYRTLVEMGDKLAFIYSTLTNEDEKQAIRTNLFDGNVPWLRAWMKSYTTEVADEKAGA